MSVTNLNDFKIEEILIIMNSIKFAVLIVGLVKFLLLQVLLHKRMILSFFSAFQSPISEEDRKDPLENVDMKKKEKVDVDVDQISVCGGEVEVFLRRLGIYCGENIPTTLDVDKIFDIFEERNPSLDEVREAFDVFDDNKDGFIGEKELQKVMCALGLKEGLKLENCRRMIGGFDEDGDGKIDFDEFVKFMENSFN